MHHKVAVTGGAGFIGSNLARSLAKENQVVIIDDLSTGRADNLARLDVEFIEGSILDLELLKQAFVGADCIFHLASIASVQRSISDPISTGRVGIEGSVKVLVAARDAGVPKVIFASSAAVYGDSPKLPKKEDMVPNPRSPYAVSKLAAEHYFQVFRELYGIETVVLRYFNVFGPKQDPTSEYSGVISRFISAMTNGNQPVIYGDGEQTRDFVYVEDIVRANILASRYGSGVFNIASGNGTSLNELARLIGKILGFHVQPYHTAPRLGDIRHSFADISKAKKIGYEPKFTLEEGLTETIKWFARGEIASK